MILPIGITCNAATELKRLGLRRCSYPFDWVSTSLTTISTLLMKVIQMSHSDIERFCRQDLFHESNGYTTLLPYKKQYYFVNRGYKLSFTHDHEPLEDACTKYIRRFKRLRDDVIASTSIVLVFVSVSNSYDEELYDLLEQLGNLFPEKTISLVSVNGFAKPIQNDRITNCCIYYDKSFEDTNSTWQKTEYVSFVNWTLKEYFYGE